MAISESYDEIGISWIWAKLMLTFKSFPIGLFIASWGKKVFSNKINEQCFLINFEQIQIDKPDYLSIEHEKTKKINFYKIIDKFAKVIASKLWCHYLLLQ